MCWVINYAQFLPVARMDEKSHTRTVVTVVERLAGARKDKKTCEKIILTADKKSCGCGAICLAIIKICSS